MKPAAEDHETITPAPHHAVQFYGCDESLFSTVAGFVGEGLVAGQPAILIATQSHRDGIVTALEKRYINVERARRLGDLVLLDANEMLEMFLIAGMPNVELFEQHVGGIIGQTLRDRGAHTVVRAYGEMVDVLWKGGRTDAAMSLELLWNRLASTHHFALLCGYSMGNFYKRIDQFQQVCAQHSHVLDMDSKVVPFELKRAVR
jgi:DcmR-like sensory protein